MRSPFGLQGNPRGRARTISGKAPPLPKKGLVSDRDFRGVSGLPRSLDIPRPCRDTGPPHKAGFVFLGLRFSKSARIRASGAELSRFGDSRQRRSMMAAACSVRSPFGASEPGVRSPALGEKTSMGQPRVRPWTDPNVLRLSISRGRHVFRLGFPLARIWWRLQRARHEGALVAIHVGQSLLVLRSSYRSAGTSRAGSVRQGETSEVSARRELAEEIGLVANASLHLVGETSGVWDGRRDPGVLLCAAIGRVANAAAR